MSAFTVPPGNSRRLPEVVAESREPSLPEPLQLVEPVAQLRQPGRAELVVAVPSVLPGRDQAGLAQYPQVLRDRRLAHVQVRGELGDRTVPGRQPLEQVPPGRIGQRGEPVGWLERVVSRSLLPLRSSRPTGHASI